MRACVCGPAAAQLLDRQPRSLSGKAMHDKGEVSYHCCPESSRFTVRRLTARQAASHGPSATPALYLCLLCWCERARSTRCDSLIAAECKVCKR